MAHILVFGATGFLGRHLLAKLAEQKKDKVTAVSRGAQSDFANITFHYCDLSRPGFTRDLPKDVDVIVWVAQSLEYRHFPDGAADMKAVNIDAVFELCEWARKAGCKKFIYSSTGSVYPVNSGKKSFSEDDVQQPDSFYPASKYCAELILVSYAKYFDVIIPRLVTLYGPGQSGMLIANMIDNVSNDKTITLANGDGPLLAPLYVEDCVAAYGAFISMDIEHGKLLVVNVGGGEQTTLAQVVAYIGQSLGKAPVIEETEGTPPSIVLDLSRFQRVCPDFKFTPVAEGIRQTVAATITSKQEIVANEKTS